MAWEWVRELGDYTMPYSASIMPDTTDTQVYDLNMFGNAPTAIYNSGDYVPFDVSWDVGNDNQLILKAYYEGWYTFRLSIVCTGIPGFMYSTGSNNYTGCAIGIAINHDLELAAPVWFDNVQHRSYYRLSNVYVRSYSSYATDEHTLYQVLMGLIPPSAITSNGGGATHIAKVTGQLKDLSSNLSDILIVSGGGGGGMLVGETEYVGADAGGISGSGDNSADQSSGYAFGQGESGADVPGGGGGLYGGYKGGTS